MVRVTISSITPGAIPTDGWVVRYRIKGTSGAYTTVGPFNALPINFSTTDAAGTLYEGFIKRDCGALESTEYAFTTPCACTQSGYAPNAGGNQCVNNMTVAPTVSNPGYCLIASTNTVYSQYGGRIYTSNFVSSDIHIAPGTPVGGHIAANLTTASQWANAGLSATIGPMNREGVWVDADCDGNKDSLVAGTSATLSFQYNNVTGSNKTVFVGLGADNNFKLLLNGTLLCDSAVSSDSNPFKLFHIFPVILPPGVNYINAVAVGDGTINDSLAMVVYDNSIIELSAATSDASLNILFKSSSLRGGTYDVSTCPSGWSLDTSAGTGNYICRKTVTMACNTAP